MRTAIRTILLGLLVMVSFSLFATPAGGPLNNDGSPNCWGGASMDTCFHAGDWWATTYQWMRDGSVRESTSCGLSAGCAACTQTSGGKVMCGYAVKYSASCTCFDRRPPGAGPGITTCDASGTCVYAGQP